MREEYDPHANAYDEKHLAGKAIGVLSVILCTGLVDSQVGLIGDRIPLGELAEFDNAVAALGRGVVLTTAIAVILWLRGYSFMRWGSYTPRKPDEDAH